MKLQEIRSRTAFDPNALPTQKAAVRAWLGGMSKDFPLSLTLTLKQTIVEKNDRGVYRRTLKRDDCERIAKRFIQKLNRQVFGMYAAGKCGKSLKYCQSLKVREAISIFIFTLPLVDCQVTLSLISLTRWLPMPSYKLRT